MVLVSNHYYAESFLSGGLLSYIWWGNSRTAAHSDVRYAQLTYAFGAACGTLNGMLLGTLWQRL